MVIYETVTMKRDKHPQKCMEQAKRQQTKKNRIHENVLMAA